MFDENNNEEIRDLETGNAIPSNTNEPSSAPESEHGTAAEFLEKEEATSTIPEIPTKKETQEQKSEESTTLVEKKQVEEAEPEEPKAEESSKDSFKIDEAEKTVEAPAASTEVKSEEKEELPQDKDVKIVYAGTQSPDVDIKPEQIEKPEEQPVAEKPIEAPREAAKPAPEKPIVEPVKVAPEVKPGVNQSAPKTQAAPTNPGQGISAKPGAPVSAAQGKQEVQKGKKVIWGCLGAFLISFIIFLTIVFIFVSGPADTPNPLAELLKINQNTFIKYVINIVNLVFIILALSSITATLIGFFKMSMAKKDDKITKKKGLVMTITGVISFIVTLLIWVGVYLYLDSKRSDIIEENTVLPPVATQPEETLNLTAPITIKFDASNAPIDTRKYQIISYVWDFDDGKTQTGQIVSYTFSDKGDKDGRYNVRLTITKKDRKTGEEIKEEFEKIVSIANVKVAAQIEADPLKGPIPLTVKFDASNSADEDGKITSYAWDFDEDGLFDDAEGPEAEYTFEKVGEYKVSLQVTDNNNESAETSLIIEAEKAEKPEAIITTNNDSSKFEANISYVFDAKNSKSPKGKIVEYYWNFGDGSKEEKTRTVSHTFKEAGTYEVELTIVDENGDDATTTEKFVVGEFESDLNAIILTQPEAVEGLNKVEGEVPFKVTFTAEKGKFSPEIIEYHWDFDGDGKTDSFEKSTTHTYQAAGTYTAKLKVVGADETEFSASTNVNVLEQGIKVDVKATPVEGVVPLTVDFDASGSTHPSSTISSFEWDFGDGSAPKKSASKISYKFTKIGTFVVTATANGADGSTAIKQVNINVLPVPLKSCFEPSIKEGTAPLTVQFNSICTTGTVVKYAWKFGDEKSSTSNNPTHVFEEAGEYNVELEVSDNDNVVSTDTVKIIVTAAEE